MKRFAKGGRLVVLALLAAFTLLLSGCFRPAGDTIQPTSAPGDTSAQQTGGATATVLPAITLLSPDNSVATATQPAMAITEVTLAPATVAVATEAVTTGPVTATLQIITPGISLGLLTPDTPIPGPTALPSPGVGESTEEASTGSDVAASDVNALVSGDECTYTVEPGDSLYLIAINNDTTVADIQAVNDDLAGAAPVLQIGQVIRMPDCGEGSDTSVDETSPTEPAPEAVDEPTPLPADTQTYTVRPGDTLGAIATRLGTTVNAIMRANGMENPNVLDVGQELIIPVPAN